MNNQGLLIIDVQNAMFTEDEPVYNGRLKEELEKAGVGKLVLAGMQTELCVDTTCRRAFSLGYESILVKDAHTTFDSTMLKAIQIIEHHNSIWHGRFATLVPVQDIRFLR
jgi:nicotinamidase-related amidase